MSSRAPNPAGLWPLRVPFGFLLSHCRCWMTYLFGRTHITQVHSGNNGKSMQGLLSYNVMVRIKGHGKMQTIKKPDPNDYYWYMPLVIKLLCELELIAKQLEHEVWLCFSWTKIWVTYTSLSIRFQFVLKYTKGCNLQLVTLLSLIQFICKHFF